MMSLMEDEEEEEEMKNSIYLHWYEACWYNPSIFYKIEALGSLPPSPQFSSSTQSPPTTPNQLSKPSEPSHQFPQSSSTSSPQSSIPPSTLPVLNQTQPSEPSHRSPRSSSTPSPQSSIPPSPLPLLNQTLYEGQYHYKCGSAAIGSVLYLFGGKKRGRSVGVNGVFCFDAYTKQMSKYPKPMLSNRSSPLALTIGKKIYLFGSQFHPDPWAEVLDTEAISFTPLCEVPPQLSQNPRIAASAIIKKGKQILLATEGGGLLFRYNVEDDTWERPEEDHPLLTGSFMFSKRSAVLNNIVYCFNGWKVYAFDLDTNQWIRGYVLSLLEYRDELDTEVILGVRHNVEGAVHCLGNGTLSVVFIHFKEDKVHIHCVSFIPRMLTNEDGKIYCGHASILCTRHHEVNDGEYVDSVALTCTTKLLPASPNQDSLAPKLLPASPNQDSVALYEVGSSMEVTGNIDELELSNSWLKNWVRPEVLTAAAFVGVLVAYGFSRRSG